MMSPGSLLGVSPLAVTSGILPLVEMVTTAGSTDFDAVVAALQSANFTDAISGPISFTPERTLARSNFVVLEGKGGAWTLAQ